AVFVSAFWLGATTVFGSELGALALFALMLEGTSLATTKLAWISRHGLGLDFRWLGMWELRNLIWSYSVRFRSGPRQRDATTEALLSDVAFDLGDGAVEIWPRIAPSAALAILVLAAATAFLRRTRPDLQPSKAGSDHPLRNLIRRLHAWKRRYAPDGGLGRERWCIAVGVLVAVLVFLGLARHQSYYRELAGERYRAEAHNDPATPTHPDTAFESWRIKGRIDLRAGLEAQLDGELVNGGPEPVSELSLQLARFTRLEAFEIASREVEVSRDWDRLRVKIVPPLPSGERVRARVVLSGEPRMPELVIRSRDRHASFASRYQRAASPDGFLQLGELKYSERGKAVTAGRIALEPHQILPLLRYTAWDLTPPPAIRFDPGLEVPKEHHFPAARISIELRLPPDTFLADSCGNASRNGALEGSCTAAPGRYLLRGGPHRPAASDGRTLMAALPGHGSEAERHFETLSAVTRLSGSAWPGLPSLEKLVILEWPVRYSLFQGLSHGFFARPKALEVLGSLVTISEGRWLDRSMIPPEALAGPLLVGRLLDQRALAVADRPALESLLGGLMTHAMGLDSGRGATISGAPFLRADALVPISHALPSNRMIFEKKLPALAIDLKTRVGADNLRRAIDRFLRSDAEGEGTIAELFAEIEAVSGRDLDTFHQQYWSGHGLPELRL
ncbi:MAG: hypothetical protein MI919_14900, partial [Holophagales bacterium]|nr:hypothetical protein [Holophagales bacterium]